MEQPQPPMGEGDAAGGAAGETADEAEAPSTLPSRPADPYADMLDTLNAEGSSMSIEITDPRVA